MSFKETDRKRDISLAPSGNRIAATLILRGLLPTNTWPSIGLYTHYRHKRTGQDTTEFFLTARRSVVSLHCQTAGMFDILDEHVVRFACCPSTLSVARWVRRAGGG